MCKASTGGELPTTSMIAPDKLTSTFLVRFRKMSPVATKVHTDEHQNHLPAAEGESKEQIESDVQDKKNLSQKHSFSKPLELSFETCNTRQ